MSRKKSTCGLLCTKNRTGCRSITTFNTKSGGVPGRTVCLTTPSWCECINVSSKSNTNTLRFTIPVNYNNNKKTHKRLIKTQKNNNLILKFYCFAYLLNLCLDNGDKGKRSYFTDWCWIICKQKRKTLQINNCSLLNKLFSKRIWPQTDCFIIITEGHSLYSYYSLKQKYNFHFFLIRNKCKFSIFGMTSKKNARQSLKK